MISGRKIKNPAFKSGVFYLNELERVSRYTTFQADADLQNPGLHILGHGL